ncbi:gamma tubulin complex Spc97/GCP2 subunit Alp4 [Savitreella phatthalungensis]
MSASTVSSVRRSVSSRTTGNAPLGAPMSASDLNAGVHSDYRHVSGASKRPPATSPMHTRRADSRTTTNLDVALRETTAAPLECTIDLGKTSLVLDVTPLSALSKDLQEAHMLEDLLYVLMGQPGTYVQARPAVDEDAAMRGPEFRVAPGLDPSLRDLTEQMLRVARNYVAVQHFIDRFSRADHGTVNNALASVIRSLTSDYLVLIAQLEHQFMSNAAFTLYAMILHTRSTAQSLQIIYDLIQEFSPKSIDEANIADDPYGEQDMEELLERLKRGTMAEAPNRKAKLVKGGSTLKLITSRLEAHSGDPAAKEILSHVLREASVPYVSMLNNWIHDGVIDDGHDEFMVKEHSNIRKERLEEDYTSEYWQKRYTLRHDEIPNQLIDVSEKVLIAGKYLNVVRECEGRSARTVALQTDADPLRAAAVRRFGDSSFLINIDKAYNHANTTLLHLMLDKHEIQARLVSLKHFFFLAHSDFFTGFQDSAARELLRDSRHVNHDRLQSLLELSVNMAGSTIRGDRFKDDIRIDLAHQPLFDVLTEINNVSGVGAEEALRTGTWRKPVANSTGAAEDASSKPILGYQGLQFDYVVPFPVSLVISRKTIFLYQLLFRHLYSLRQTEDSLNISWFESVRSPAWRGRPRGDRQLEQFKARCWTLRSRMAGFVAQVNYYCTTEVVGARFARFVARLSPDSANGGNTVNTVDELMSDHFDFLNTCLKECMLTNARLLRVYAKLLKTCQAFAQFVLSVTRQLEEAGLSQKQQQAPEIIKAMMDKLAAYEAHFDRTLKVLLDTLNYYASTETASLLSLMLRLDWNKGLRDDVLDDL